MALSSKSLTNNFLLLILLHFSCIFLLNHLHLGLASAHPLYQNKTPDLLALLSIKSLLHDPYKALASWDNESLHYCEWHGVICETKHLAQVSALNLDSFGLSGLISPQIANLTFLHQINLANNQLHGLIPQELGLLTHLEHLNMENNILQGFIPNSLGGCIKLKTLSLKNNKLTGDIPSCLGSLPVLHTLELSNNELTGSLFSLSKNNSLIKYINISSNNLTGTIPPSLFNYSLKYLNLKNNKIGGYIPVSLGSSSSLEYVNLDQNNLVGSIPSSLCTTISSIKYLLLARNKISGTIPSTLANCSNLANISLHVNNLTGPLPSFGSINSHLEYLSLQGNQLSGSIPPSLSNNSALVSLRLIQNSFSGTIPESLGRLSRLSVLDLSVNSLTGIIPSSIYNLTFLTFLGLGENRFTGRIPKNIGVAFPKLVSLIMNDNKFEGNIPSLFCNASELKFIDLQYNSFWGLVPSNLGCLQNLVEVDLSSNELEVDDWNFLVSLGNCSVLNYLSLENNKLNGTLPYFIGNLSTSLRSLSIGQNHFSGSIPTEIENLVGLTLLSMNHGHFSGRIPGAIGRLQQLNKLKLGGNRFSGPIPFSIGNLSMLSEVCLEENELTSSIPSSFGNCTTLTFLNLSHNFFTGNVPKELVSLFSLTIALDFSHNLLNGPLPMEIGKLINLVRLDISNNNFSHEIPSTLGQCPVLQYLYMDGNNFQGNIPTSFANLKSMIELDLSRNHLTGPIPCFFSFFDSLQFLNLSFNDLQGELKDVGIFKNNSRFSIAGNVKLCGGLQMLQLPPCVKQSPWIRRFNQKITTIIATVAMIFLMLSLVIFVNSKRKKCINSSVSFTSDKYKKITYHDVAQATDWFSPVNLVGSGSFGLVYKGKLGPLENLVAVKVFRNQYSRALKSFQFECEALKNLRHRNLVKVITSCSSLDSKGNEFKAIVFEYMHNRSLEEWLHPSENMKGASRILNLKQRISIATDVAFALNYLHNECSTPLVHCDLKPSNVLLDNDMIAHVSDFGLSRFLGEYTSLSSFGMLRGSIGYAPPEYGIGSPLSTRGDVYSYGVLLLEMLTGKRPTDNMFDKGFSLRTYVDRAFPDKLVEILDPALFQDEHEGSDDQLEIKLAGNLILEKIIIPFAEVSLQCSTELPKERMETKDVATKISRIKMHFLVGV